MQPVIEIRDISKRFELGEKPGFYGSFREVLVQAARKPWDMLRGASRNGNGRPVNSFWALRGVSFDIRGGETVGIIGANGAGKSTLLKILSRITEPTEGEVRVRGRLASLLEVGTGFHPELTGRENIYLNGAILGMTKVEIENKFDEIVAFSEIPKFLDTPVKRYSSGMYVRLAFSIAAHLDPDILIVDEVLAVGDVAFQKKCMAKMADARARARTVVFVSHNVAAIESLCDRVVVLREGKVVFDGATKDGIDCYLDHVTTSGNTSHSHMADLSKAVGRSPQYKPQLTSLELYTNGGRPVLGDVAMGASLKAIIRFKLEKPCNNFHASIAFDTVTGQRICTAHSAYEPERPNQERSGEQTFICEIPSLPLIAAEYKVGVGLDMGDQEVDWVNDALRLTVTRADFYRTGIVPVRGTFLLQNRWKLLEDRQLETVPPFGNGLLAKRTTERAESGVVGTT